jgi:DNA-binding LacI/PurR family transcriptional regulator
MKVSIKDIAKAAGVSHSTVSRALSNNPLIPEKTRQRIERIASKLGYTPNAIARGLVTNQTRAVGVIVTSIADPFVSEVVRGIEEIAGNNRYRVFLGTSHNDPEREVNSVKALREWRVDSVIVESSRVGSLYGPFLQEIGVPIVLINNQHPGTFIRSVMVNDVQGAKLATSHLISLGHRVIAHIRGPAGYRATKNRLTGYRTALKKAGIPFDPTLLQAGNGRAEAGEQVIPLLSHSPKPTAIFCYNDMTAIGALSALKRCGVRVPQDISIVGFDDIPFAMYTDPPLTTIHQPTFDMGQRAMQMALTLMNSPETSVENIVIQGQLIGRNSSSQLGG